VKIQSESSIHHPLELVYRSYRDHLSDVAPYTPDVKEIRVHSREELPQGPKIHNEWIVDRKLPRVVQGLITPDMMRWNDFAQWDDAQHHVDWVLQIPAFPNQVHCSGRNAFFADGPDATIVRLSGDLQIYLKNVPGIPRLLAGRLTPKVEAFIVKLVTPNLERVNHSLEQYLDAEGAGPD
jgi:hypothetical protein